MLAAGNMCDSSHCQAQDTASRQVVPSACGRAWLGPRSLLQLGQEPRRLQRPNAHQNVSHLLQSAHCAALVLDVLQITALIATAPAACHMASACQWLTSTPPIFCPCSPIQTPCATADHEEAKCGDINGQRWHQLSTKPWKPLLSRVVACTLALGARCRAPLAPEKSSFIEATPPPGS